MISVVGYSKNLSNIIEIIFQQNLTIFQDK